MDILKNIIPEKMYEVIEKAGIGTARQILALSVWDIKKITSMNDEDILYLKNLVSNHICPLIISGEKMENQIHIKTGCLSIDTILNGGFRTGTLTEVYGESGTGKTQLAMQTAAQCGNKGSVYICTEDVFPVKRFNEICDNIYKDHVYDFRQHTFIEHITESQELIACIRVRLPKLLKEANVSVIIIDSVAAPLRFDVTNYVQRAEELRELGILLINMAINYNLAVLCINQVTSSFDELDNVLPSLGLAWSNMISYRLFIRRIHSDKNDRELAITFSPDLDTKKCMFRIDISGLKTV